MEKINFARDIWLLIIAFFISEGTFTFKVEGAGFVTSEFFVRRVSEVIIILLSLLLVVVAVSMRTSKNKFYCFCLVHG